MVPMGKMLIIAGIVMIVAGLFIQFGPRIPWLGKLPGDIRIEGKSGSFYFPIVTCIVISILLSILLNLFRGR